MSTNFFITQVTVNFPGTGHDYDPLIYKYNGNNMITWGVACPNSFSPDDPIKIYKLGDSPKSGNSFLNIATSRGQYQLYWNDGSQSNPYNILLQSLTNAAPYPNNQQSLWTGSAASQNFTLHIDMTQLTNNNGISLIPA